jgi:hypothetical protein
MAQGTLPQESPIHKPVGQQQQISYQQAVASVAASAMLQQLHSSLSACLCMLGTRVSMQPGDMVLLLLAVATAGSSCRPASLRTSGGIFCQERPLR